MSDRRPDALHPDEPVVDEPLVRRLLQADAPDLAHLPLAPAPILGTTNWVFRLGDEHSVRLPRVPYGEEALAHERRWLGPLAAALDLELPHLVAEGRPTAGYPFAWSIHGWVPGRAAGDATADERRALVPAVAAWLGELAELDPAGAPEAGRGRPLPVWDETLRRCLGELEGAVDAKAALELWQEALDLGPFAGPPTWLHGDLLPDNLLLRDGRLAGVIDSAGSGIGDPSGDLLLAWNLFEAEERAAFRAALGVDDATWLRGRARAMAQAVIFLPYYAGRHPRGEAQARRALGHTLGQDRTASRPGR